MKGTKIIGIGGGVLLACALQAQQFRVDWFTVDGGGGASTNGTWAIAGTIGQMDAGVMSNGAFKVEGGFWGGITLVQTPGAPLLVVRRQGANVVLAWALGATGFQLEETKQFGSADWSPTTYPVVDTTTEHTIVVPATESLRFYRLRKL